MAASDEHNRLTALAGAASEAGRLAEAEAYLRQILAWRTHSLTLSSLASCLVAQGRLEEALGACAAALAAAEAPEDPQIANRSIASR